MQEIYLKNLKEKHNLLKKTKSPKIILVGGSNLAFGVDSSLIEKMSGYNTINMGLDAGIGLGFMCNHVKPFINRNDIVILAPSYLCFKPSTYLLNGTWALIMALSNFREGLKYLKPSNFYSIAKHYSRAVNGGKKLRKWLKEKKIQ